MTRFVPPRSLLELAEAVRRHPEPPTCKDASALSSLEGMLGEAATRLRAIAGELVVVASAPNRFNDVSNFEWSLVRVDHETVEGDAYVTSRAAFVAELAASSPALRSAAAVLADLEARDWRGTWIRAFGLPLDEEFLAIVIQRGAPFFLYASSNLGGREHVFSLWDGLRYFGECVGRTDEALIGLSGDGGDALAFDLEGR